MKGYQELLQFQKQKSRQQQRLLPEQKIPSIKNLVRDNLSRSRTPNRSPNVATEKVKRSMGNFYIRDSQDSSPEFYSETVIKVTEQNARLTEERKALFRKNCELVNQINQIKKDSRIKSSADLITGSAKSWDQNIRASKHYENKQQMQFNENSKYKMTPNNKRVYEQPNYVSYAQKASYYGNQCEDAVSLKIIKHQSTPNSMSNNNKFCHSSKNLLATQKKISGYTKGNHLAIHDQYSPCASQQQIYLAEKTTPIPESTDIIESIKRKSSKYFPATKKYSNAPSSASNYETTSSYKKKIIPANPQYMLVKMCNHCADELSSNASGGNLNINQGNIIQNTIYESQETLSNACTPKNKQYTNRTELAKSNPCYQFPIDSLNKKTSTLEQLEEKIKRIRVQNKKLRSQVLIE